jgi:hypothetical protein
MLKFFNLESQKYDILEQVLREQTATQENSLTLLNLLYQTKDAK